MQVQSLGWEDPLEKGMAIHSIQYPCLGNPTDREAWQLTVCGVERVGYDLVTKQQQCMDSWYIIM